MVKTTLYLPEELKERLERAAADEKRSEADFIREAIAAALDGRARPKPTIGFFDSGDPHFSEKVDEYMVGFGED
jgi:plasmid stability protein